MAIIIMAIMMLTNRKPAEIICYINPLAIAFRLVIITCFVETKTLFQRFDINDILAYGNKHSYKVRKNLKIDHLVYTNSFALYVLHKIYKIY